MIREVHLRRSEWNDLPWKFEAGTPDISAAIGLGVAADYLRELGMDAVREHERDLVAYALETLRREVPDIELYGPPADLRGGVVPNLPRWRRCRFGNRSAPGIPTRSTSPPGARPRHRDRGQGSVPPLSRCRLPPARRSSAGVRRCRRRRQAHLCGLGRSPTHLVSLLVGVNSRFPVSSLPSSACSAIDSRRSAAASNPRLAAGLVEVQKALQRLGCLRGGPQISCRTGRRGHPRSLCRCPRATPGRARGSRPRRRSPGIPAC